LLEPQELLHWQLLWDSLRVNAADVEVMGNGIALPRAGSGSATHDVSITNRMAAFDGGAVTTQVGSARREVRSINDKAQDEFELEVLPGTTALVVRVTELTDPDADLDVFVFDCSGEECRAARTDGDPFGDESVFVERPAAGMWKVVVDAASVPSGNTFYRYLDVAFNPSYGTVGVADLPQDRTAGARWTTKAHTWIAPAAHEAGRVPYVALMVMGEQPGADPYVVTLQELTVDRRAETVTDRQGGLD